MIDLARQLPGYLLTFSDLGSAVAEIERYSRKSAEFGRRAGSPFGDEYTAIIVSGSWTVVGRESDRVKLCSLGDPNSRLGGTRIYPQPAPDG